MNKRWLLLVGPIAFALHCNGSSSVDAGDAATQDVAVDSAPDVTSCTPTAPPADPLATMRTQCTFAAGARVADTIGDVTAARSAIQHVVVLIQENHSMDQMFGTTGHGIEGFPSTFSNPLAPQTLDGGAPSDGGSTPDGSAGPDASTIDGGGTPGDAGGSTADAGFAAPFHYATTCPMDTLHQWDAIHAEWDHGAMDGFARVNGTNAMGYFTDADHPFYSWLATTFATSDRYFSSVLGGTWPNRDYLYCGTADGVRLTLIGVPHTPSVFDELDAAHVTWGDYVSDDSDPLEGALGWDATHPNVLTIDQLLPAIDSGHLPSVVFIDPGENTLDEHPPANIHDGENFSRTLVQHLMTSPLWMHTALFITYDEAGGFFEHVPPPTACVAAANESDVDHYGFRVPVMAVSPWARPAYVSHNVHSHTSILRFIQAVFDLPALTVRDANSDAMLELFDFTCPAFAAAPSTIPAAGMGACM